MCAGGAWRAGADRRCWERASLRFLEFFASTIRNPHTRRANGRAVVDFLTSCEEAGVQSLVQV